jgi:hypothetical protein
MARSSRSDLTARDAEILLEEKAVGGQNSDSAWMFDIWKHSF